MQAMCRREECNQQCKCVHRMRCSFQGVSSRSCLDYLRMQNLSTWIPVEKRECRVSWVRCRYVEIWWFRALQVLWERRKVCCNQWILCSLPCRSIPASWNNRNRNHCRTDPTDGRSGFVGRTTSGMPGMRSWNTFYEHKSSVWRLLKWQVSAWKCCK